MPNKQTLTDLHANESLWLCFPNLTCFAKTGRCSRRYAADPKPFRFSLMNERKTETKRRRKSSPRVAVTLRNVRQSSVWGFYFLFSVLFFPFFINLARRRCRSFIQSLVSISIQVLEEVRPPDARKQVRVDRLHGSIVPK